MDPLERKNIYIQSGKWGDALYAKRAFKSGELVAYYCGIIFESKLIPWGNMTKTQM
jgi:hypothetical protein